MRLATIVQIEYRKKDVREPAMKISTNIVMYSFRSFISVFESRDGKIMESYTFATISRITWVKLSEAHKRRQNFECSTLTVWKRRVRMVRCFPTSSFSTLVVFVVVEACSPLDVSILAFSFV